jgi:hypothetical protein
VKVFKLNCNRVCRVDTSHYLDSWIQVAPCWKTVPSGVSAWLDGTSAKVRVEVKDRLYNGGLVTVHSLSVFSVFGQPPSLGGAHPQ